MKRPLTPGIKGALAQARVAIESNRDKDEPVKDLEEIAADAEAWREKTYTEEEA